MRSSLKHSIFAVACTIGMLNPAAAFAVTLDGFQGQRMDSIYGDYAIICGDRPSITIDENGFTFRVGAKEVKSRRFEHALTYLGPDYQGITKVFFPFPVSDDDPGPVVLLVNDGEKPGTMRVEPNLGPGQRADPFHAALTAKPLYKLCIPMIPPPRCGAATTPRADLPAQGTPWEVVQADGGTRLAHVAAAGSLNIESFSLFCEGRRPVIAMLLKGPSKSKAMTLSWSFAGSTVAIPMSRSNPDGTFWQAYLTGSPLVPTLLRQTGSAWLRINGWTEGEASLAGAPVALRAALGSCQRL